jgi:hypothetical protein
VCRVFKKIQYKNSISDFNIFFVYTAWASPSISSEGAVAPIAVDASNPWGNNCEPTPVLEPTAPDEGGWADFESAGFADFEANFGATSVTDIASSKSANDCKNCDQETAKTDSDVTVSTALVECKLTHYVDLSHYLQKDASAPLPLKTDYFIL